MRAFIYTGGGVYTEHLSERPEKEDLIIAADAGYLTLKKLGITPHIMLGDFDSLGSFDAPEGVEILRVPAEKNDTDTQLAVKTALERGARELVIVGGMDGRVDHTLSNLAILEDLQKRHIRAVLTNGKNRARFLRDDGALIPREHFRYLSLIAADKKVKGVTLQGCKYPLKNATLSRLNQYAVSNEIEGNCALVEIRRGGVWVIESMD